VPSSNGISVVRSPKASERFRCRRKSTRSTSRPAKSISSSPTTEGGGRGAPGLNDEDDLHADREIRERRQRRSGRTQRFDVHGRVGPTVARPVSPIRALTGVGAHVHEVGKLRTVNHVVSGSTTADMAAVRLPRVEVMLGLLLVALPRLDTIDRVRRFDGRSRRYIEAVRTWKTSSASRGFLTGRAILT
jgi:hypothetical protein